jgi:hypothetical protein
MASPVKLELVPYGIDKFYYAQGLKLLASCDPVYSEILTDIERNKEDLPLFQIALHTITGLGLLAKNYTTFSIAKLKSQARSCGFVIHINNYLQIESFQRAVIQITCSVKDIFSSSSPRERFKFYRLALTSPGCFEDRVETIMGYTIETDTFGFLKHEAQIYQSSNGEGPIPLSDFIAHLIKNEISPESFGIDRTDPRRNPNILQLERLGYILPPLSTAEKVKQAALEYITEPHPTLAGLKEYLIHNGDLSADEIAGIDRLIDGYLQDSLEVQRILQPGPLAPAELPSADSGALPPTH